MKPKQRMLNRPTRWQRLASALLVVSLVACEGAGASPAPSTVAPAIEVAFATPHTPTVTPPLAAATAGCRSVAHRVAPTKPATFGEGMAALATYLNAGATMTAVMEAARNWGYLYADPATNQVWGGVQAVNVLTGAVPQFVMTMFDAAQIDPQNPGTHVGDLAVFACVKGQYAIVYQAAADPLFSGLVLNPRLVSNVDVTGDGLDDLGFVTGDCSAESCVDALTVVSAHGLTTGAPTGLIRNILPDIDAISLINPTFTFAPASHGAGQNLFAITGLIAETSAGPQRVITDTWAFDGAIFTRTASLPAPPVYRIHALHDGDAAFRRKDFAAAEALYLRVVNDPALQVWEGDAPLQDEPQILAAMAYVRLIQTAAARGNATAAQVALAALMAAMPAGSPGELYAELGRTFWATFQQSNDDALACAAAIAFAGNNPNTYLVLGQDTYGYANPGYTADEMCIS